MSADGYWPHFRCLSDSFGVMNNMMLVGSWLGKGVWGEMKTHGAIGVTKGPWCNLIFSMSLQCLGWHRASRGPPWTCREAALGALARGLGVGVNHGTKHARISIARAMLILFSELHRVHEYFIYHSLRYTTPNKIH